MADLKPEWKRVVLGDVVDVVTEYWDRNADVPERFVAGEHIDEGDLSVRRWGMTSDELVPPTFNRRFRARDVLFHSRNLKKLACPDFDGITGEKLFVLRSKDPKRLLPELLPFLLQTNDFNEYVNRMWAGSTNKFLNKAPLVKYAFALPPLEEQRKIVGVLASAHAAVYAAQKLEHSAKSVRLSTLVDYEKRYQNKRALQELSRVPVTYGIVKAGVHVDTGVPYVRVTDITAGIRLNSKAMLKTTEEVSRSYCRTILEDGDCIIAVKAARGVVGQARRVSSGLAGANISRDVARAAPGDGVDPGYLYWALQMPSFMTGVQARETGWKGDSLREITIGALRTVPVTWIPPREQRQFAQTLDVLEEASISAARRVAEMRTVAASVLASVMRRAT